MRLLTIACLVSLVVGDPATSFNIRRVSPARSSNGNVNSYLTQICGTQAHSSLTRASERLTQAAQAYQSAAKAAKGAVQKYIRGTSDCVAHCMGTKRSTGSAVNALTSHFSDICPHRLAGGAHIGRYLCVFACQSTGGRRAPQRSSRRSNRNSRRPSQASAPVSGGSFADTCLRLTNDIRRRAGLSPLVLDNKAMNMCNDQSQCMRSRGLMDHNACQSFPSRLKRFGINGAAAENIGEGLRSAERAVHEWYESKPHRANILKANMRKLGCCNSGDYCTQVFSS